MKLHLPLGLLSALLLVMSVPSADAVLVSKEYTFSNWVQQEVDLGTLYKLTFTKDDGSTIAIDGSSNFTIRARVTFNASSGSVSFGSADSYSGAMGLGIDSNYFGIDTVDNSSQSHGLAVHGCGVDTVYRTSSNLIKAGGTADIVVNFIKDTTRESTFNMQVWILSPGGTFDPSGSPNGVAGGSFVWQQGFTFDSLYKYGTSNVSTITLTVMEDAAQQNIYTWGGGNSMQLNTSNTLIANYGDTSDLTMGELLKNEAYALYSKESSSQANILRFVPAGTYTVGSNLDEEIEIGNGTAITAPNGTFVLAGLILEEGATGYSIVPDASDYDSAFSLVSADGESPELIVNEDFSLGSDEAKFRNITLQSTPVITIASGKTFSIYGDSDDTDNTGVILLEGGGTLALHGDKILGAHPLDIKGGSTLDMGGGIAGSGQIAIYDGSLKNASAHTGSVTIDALASAKGIDMGKLRADLIQSVSTSSADTYLKNIGNGTLSIKGISFLSVGAKNFTSSESSGTYLLGFADAATGKIVFNPGSKFILTAAEGVLTAIDGYMYFWLSNGTIEIHSDENYDLSDFSSATEWLNAHFTLPSAITSASIFEMEPGNSGKIRLVISTDGTWISSKHGETINQVDRLNDKWQAVIVDTSLTFNLTPEGDNNTTIIRHLQAEGSNGKLTINNNGSEQLYIELENASGTNASGAEITPDTVFNKDIVVSKNSSKVTLRKTGDAQLTVNGNVTTDGSLEVVDGTLELNGDKNSVGSVSALSGDDSTGKLVIGGQLTVKGASDVSAADGSISGDGTLIIKKSFTAGASTLNNANTLTLQLDEGSTFVMGSGSAQLGGLAGDGTLNMGSNSKLTITGGKTSVFSGALAGSTSGSILVTGKDTDQTLQTAGNANRDLEVADHATLTLIGATSKARAASAAMATAAYHNIDVQKDATLNISAEQVGAQYAAGTTITANNITFAAGSNATIAYNFTGADDKLQTNDVAPAIIADTITIEDGAHFTLNNVGSMFSVEDGEDLTGFVFMQANTINASSDTLTDIFTKSGAFLVYYKDVDIRIVDGKVLIDAKYNNENIFEQSANSYNASAGAGLLWEARKSEEANNFLTSQFYHVMSTLAYVGSDPAYAGDVSRALAAVAGSTTPALGTAQKEAMRGQMNRMRDHTSLMGMDADYAYDSLPYFHAWVQAEGEFTKLNADGDESGYKLNSWGGTVGVDVDFNEHVSVGAGISALYGSLSANSADSADGDLDSYYLTLMARVQGRRWAHTFIATYGLTKANLDRTVNYIGGAYKTTGSTDGYSAGLMYEATYDIPLNADKTRVLQPLLNLSVMKTSLGSYRENGPDGLGLNVGSQDWTVATIAAGARWIGVVGSNVFARAAQLELRANVAQDLGDSQGEAQVAVQANPAYRRSVRAAEVGQTALQLGAGLRIPVGMQSLLYFNANSDFRSGMTSWNLTAGMRYDF